MKIIIKFNSKSKAKGIPEAIKIAKKNKGKLEGDYYKVEFFSVTDEDLLRLEQLVGHLKQTETFRDGKPTSLKKAPAKGKKPVKKAAQPKTILKWLQEDDIFKTSKHHALQDEIREKFESAITSQKAMDFEQAIEKYIEVLRFDHREGYYFCEALSKLGRLYYLQNKFKETFEVYEKFFELYPDWDKDDGTEELYMEVAKKIGNTQKYKEIQKSINERIEARKASKEADKSDARGLGDLNLENLNEAIEAFKLALDTNFSNFDFWINLGQNFKNFGQDLDDNQYYEKAIECYKQSVEIEPNNYDALLNIGSLYEYLGNMDEAMEYFKSIMDIGDIEKINRHKEFVKENPNAIDSWIVMGDIYNDYEIYSMAINCYEEASKLNPKNVSIWISLGQTYLDSEENEKALELFMNASKAVPGNQTIKSIITKLKKNDIGGVYEILDSF